MAYYDQPTNLPYYLKQTPADPRNKAIRYNEHNNIQMNNMNIKMINYAQEPSSFIPNE